LTKETIVVDDVKIINNTDRFSNPSSLDWSSAIDFKIGDEIGPSFSTHWVKVNLQIPQAWLEQNYDIQFLWNS
jgi:hypothetical protein